MKFFKRRATKNEDTAAQTAEILSKGKPKRPISESLDGARGVGVMLYTIAALPVTTLIGATAAGFLAPGLTGLGIGVSIALGAAGGLLIPAAIGFGIAGLINSSEDNALYRYHRAMQKYTLATARAGVASEPTQVSVPEKEAAPDFNAAQKPEAPTNTAPEQPAPKDKPKPPAAP